jgi:hypothetical protein
LYLSLRVLHRVLHRVYLQVTWKPQQLDKSSNSIPTPSSDSMPIVVQKHVKFKQHRFRSMYSKAANLDLPFNLKCSKEHIDSNVTEACKSLPQCQNTKITLKSCSSAAAGQHLEQFGLSIMHGSKAFFKLTGKQARPARPCISREHSYTPSKIQR